MEIQRLHFGSGISKAILSLLLTVALGPTVFSQTNVMDVIDNSPAHTTLSALIDAAGLRSTLEDRTKQYTVFAPTNQAFNKVPPAVLASLQMNPTTDLKDVLLYHVLGQRVSSSELPASGSYVTTLNNDSVIVSKFTGGGIFMDQARVTIPNQQRMNGVVHITDGVLVPGKHVVDVAVENGFSTLATAVIAAELVPTLTKPFAKYTVFAPTDDAFAKVPTDVLSGLLATPTDGGLSGVLTYHVLGSEVGSGDLPESGSYVTTLNQDSLLVSNLSLIHI